MFGKGSHVLLLPEILKDWPCTVVGGKIRVGVNGVTEDSRKVQPGYIFVARRGAKEDGAAFIEDAIRRGAAAIVVDRNDIASLYEDVPLITVPDCRHFLSHASATLAGNPSEQLTVIAVTGTNGKTTVSHFTGQLLKKLGIRAAVIGTTGIFIDGHRMDYDVPQMTTLPAEYFHPLLKDCIAKGVTHVVLEASSLGLSTCRLAHCKIDIGILLNVGEDHYDEHGGKQQYIEAKSKLLHMADKVVVNRDDGTCVDMIRTVSRPAVFFGTDPASDIHLRMEGDRSVIMTGKEKGLLQLSTLGEFNWLNATAALSALYVLSHTLEELLPYTASLALPEGRMERLEQDGVTVVIDYAHTPDALEAVLSSLSKTCDGKLLTVFGCGGERDKGKRSEMGALAVLYSSHVLITSDNPRKEDPLAIITDIVSGLDTTCITVEIEPDRGLAIRTAIVRASKGDVVLIAGKGHEKTQHTAKGVFPFSDLEVAKAALADLKGE